MFEEIIEELPVDPRPPVIEGETHTPEGRFLF